MDEPFGAVDPVTRDALQGEVAHIHQATGEICVFVCATSRRRCAWQRRSPSWPAAGARNPGRRSTASRARRAISSATSSALMRMSLKLLSAPRRRLDATWRSGNPWKVSANCCRCDARRGARGDGDAAVKAGSPVASRRRRRRPCRSPIWCGDAGVADDTGGRRSGCLARAARRACALQWHAFA